MHPVPSAVPWAGLAPIPRSGLPLHVLGFGWFENFLIFISWCGIYTASIPSTAETHTGGGAVLGKPESSPA